MSRLGRCAWHGGAPEASRNSRQREYNLLWEKDPEVFTRSHYKSNGRLVQYLAALKKKKAEEERGKKAGCVALTQSLLAADHMHTCNVLTQKRVIVNFSCLCFQPTIQKPRATTIKRSELQFDERLPNAEYT